MQRFFLKIAEGFFESFRIQSKSAAYWTKQKIDRIHFCIYSEFKNTVNFSWTMNAKKEKRNLWFKNVNRNIFAIVSLNLI